MVSAVLRGVVAIAVGCAVALSLSAFSSRAPDAVAFTAVSHPHSAMQWIGARCQPGSSLADAPTNASIHQQAVALNLTDRCGMWASGHWATAAGDVRTLTAEVLAAAMPHKRRWRRTSRCTDVNFRTHNCSLLSWSGLELRAVLHRTTGGGTRPMVIAGDSMARQLALRLVHMVRSGLPGHSECQRPNVMEHYFHTDFTYIVSPAGDELIVQHEMARKLPVKCRTDRNAVDALFRLCFVWDSYQSKYAPGRTADAALRYEPGIMVALPSYHWALNAKGAASQADDIHRQLHHVYGVLKDEPLVPKAVRPLWFVATVPELPPHQIRLGQRNALLRAWAVTVATLQRAKAINATAGVFGAMGVAAAASVTELHLIDWATAPLPQRCDGMHFGCSLTPMSPNPIERVKLVCNGCRDDMNCKLINIIGNAVATAVAVHR
jgi:hypothetical protein